MKLIADNREIELLREIEEHLRERAKWTDRRWFGEHNVNEFRKEVRLRDEAIALVLLQLERHHKSLDRITSLREASIARSSASARGKALAEFDLELREAE